MRSAAIKKLLWLVFYSLPLLAFAANFTEPRGEASKAPGRPNDSRPVKTVVYKSRRASLAGPSRAPAGSLSSRGSNPTTQQVKAYVRTQAVEYGVNPNLALWIVKHESQFNPRAKGDGEASRGLWQISKVYHPEVSDAEAFSVASSTQWSLGRIRSGKVNEWSSYRYCKTLYDDCPY